MGRLSEPGPLRIPYGKATLELTPPPDWRIFSAKPINGVDLSALLRRWGPPARSYFTGARFPVVVVSDHTRRMGYDDWLAPFLREMGLWRRARILVATGTHRCSSVSFLGEALDGAYEVAIHDADGRLLYFGRTRRGTPVFLHPWLREADALLLTGRVQFHYYAGFSGGPKAILPGCAGAESIQRNHAWTIGDAPPMWRREGVAPGRLEGNPVHEDILEVFRRWFAFAWMLQVVDSGAGLRFFLGPGMWAFYEAVTQLRRSGLLRTAPLDGVLVTPGGAPQDATLYQSHKALEAVLRAVRPGGRVLLCAQCAEGLGAKQLAEALRWPKEMIFRHLKQHYDHTLQIALSLLWKRERWQIGLVTSLSPKSIPFPVFSVSEGLAWLSEAGPHIAIVPDASQCLLTC